MSIAAEHLWTRSFAAAQWPNSRSAVAYPLTMTPGAAGILMGFGLVWNGLIPGITWQVDRALSFDTEGIGPGALYASLIAAASPSALPRRSCLRAAELLQQVPGAKKDRVENDHGRHKEAAIQLPGIPRSGAAPWQTSFTQKEEDTSLERSHLAFRTRDEISPMACDSAHPRSRNPHGHYDQPLLIPKSCCIRCSLARASEFILDLEAKCELPVAWYSSGLFTGWPSQRRCDACSLGPRRKQANSPQPPEKKNTGSDGSSFFAGRQSRWWTPGDLSSSTRGLYLQAKPKTISRLLHSEMPPVRPH
eukprot:s813_g2.t3